MAASVDAPDEVEAAETWLRLNLPALVFAAEGGCGCCVRVWRLEGPADVLATIPHIVSADVPDWDTE